MAQRLSCYFCRIPSLNCFDYNGGTMGVCDDCVLRNPQIQASAVNLRTALTETDALLRELNGCASCARRVYTDIDMTKHQAHNLAETAVTLTESIKDAIGRMKGVVDGARTAFETSCSNAEWVGKMKRQVYEDEGNREAFQSAVMQITTLLEATLEPSLNVGQRQLALTAVRRAAELAKTNWPHYWNSNWLDESTYDVNPYIPSSSQLIAKIGSFGTVSIERKPRNIDNNAGMFPVERREAVSEPTVTPAVGRGRGRTFVDCSPNLNATPNPGRPSALPASSAGVPWQALPACRGNGRPFLPRSCPQTQQFDPLSLSVQIVPPQLTAEEVNTVLFCDSFDKNSMADSSNPLLIPSTNGLLAIDTLSPVLEAVSPPLQILEIPEDPIENAINDIIFMGANKMPSEIDSLFFSEAAQSGISDMAGEFRLDFGESEELQLESVKIEIPTAKSLRAKDVEECCSPGSSEDTGTGSSMSSPERRQWRLEEALCEQLALVSRRQTDEQADNIERTVERVIAMSSSNRKFSANSKKAKRKPSAKLRAPPQCKICEENDAKKLIKCSSCSSSYHSMCHIPILKCATSSEHWVCTTCRLAQPATSSTPNAKRELLVRAEILMQTRKADRFSSFWTSIQSQLSVESYQDYLRLIAPSEPTDFFAISKRVSAFRGNEEFCSKCRLVFENCKKANMKGSQMYKYAEEIEEHFKKSVESLCTNL